MPTDRDLSAYLQSPSALLDALPLAAALLVPRPGAAGERPTPAATNAAWRRLWQAHFPLSPEWPASAAAPSGLDPLLDQLVDPAQAAALTAAIAAGEGVDLLLALDLDGPAVWHGRGCAVAEHYLLTLEPAAEPERVAAGWPGGAEALGPARRFRYIAALAPEGGWRIEVSAPDYRAVLRLDRASRGWLHLATPSSRRKLRSRHLKLAAGLPQRSVYGLELPDGRSLTLDDMAVPVRHPQTDEVIGLVGWAQFGDALEEPEAGRPAAPSAPQSSSTSMAATSPGSMTAPVRGPVFDLASLIRVLDGCGAVALLLDQDGDILASSARAASRLGIAAEALRGRPARAVLLADDAGGGASFASLLNDLLATDSACWTVGSATVVAGRDDAMIGRPLDLAFCPVDLGDPRLILVTLAEAPGTVPNERPGPLRGDAATADSRLRDALYFDPVTGLPNRFLCLDRLRQNIARTIANGGLSGVLFVEIDRLGVIERSFGRATADALLKTLAERFAGAIDGLDTAAYLGEARFAVLAGNLVSAEEAARIAQLLLDQVAMPIAFREREIGTGGRVGIAVFPDDGDSAETLLANAETALERLPKSQLPAYHFYTSAMNAASSDRLLLEQQLLDAIERDEFLLLYQPQISFASSRIVGMEALIRWRHPDLGMVPPGEFIPIAEETGAIVAIGDWVMRTACRELASWLDAGVAPLRLALNISGRQYNEASLLPSVRETLAATGFPPHLLELELTESVIMEDVVDAATRLGDLHDLGINLAVDDFGTGYSSLSYLKRFPIRSLKVDRSFVRDIAHDESSASIARAIIAFGSALGLKVIAEGVESHDQYDILRGCGCDELQGYLFSRPIPAEDARKLATERRHLPLGRR